MEERQEQVSFVLFRLASPKSVVFQIVFLICAEAIVPSDVQGSSVIHEAEVCYLVQFFNQLMGGFGSPASR